MKGFFLNIRSNIKITFLLIFCMITLNTLYSISISYFFGVGSQNSSRINDEINQNFFWNVLSLLLFAPVLEELFFRKFIPYSIFKALKISVFKTKITVIILVNLIFSLMHNDVYFLIPIFMNGLIYAYIFYKTSYIVYSIFAHIIYNFVSFMIYFI